jgi:5-methylcytosine-specific restriction endonuclease McrA
MSPVEKSRARASAWQKNNPERRKEIRAKWIANNLEKMRAIRKAWKLANSDKVKDERAAWMRSHPETRARNEEVRRARKLDIGGSFTVTQIQALYKLQQECCAICSDKLNGKYHRDHIMPLALSGSNDISNIQLLCQPCNSKKGAKHPLEYANKLGKLL